MGAYRAGPPGAPPDSLARPPGQHARQRLQQAQLVRYLHSTQVRIIGPKQCLLFTQGKILTVI